MSDVRIRRIPPGVSGIEGDDGGIKNAPKAKKPNNGQSPRLDKRHSKESRAKISEAMRQMWARRRSGAARAGRATPKSPAAQPATTAAPSSPPGRDLRPPLEVSIEALRQERDSLTQIIDQLEKIYRRR